MAEMLLAMLILLLASLIMVTGIPAAKNAYEKVVLASNAEVLLSTTVSALRGELGTARDVKAGEPVNDKDPAQEGTILTYRSLAREAYSRLFIESIKEGKSSHNVIMLQRYYDDLVPAKTSEPEKLIRDKTATADLYVTYSAASYNEETHIVTIKDLSVNRKSGSTGLAKRDTVSIRVLSD